MPRIYDILGRLRELECTVSQLTDAIALLSSNEDKLITLLHADKANADALAAAGKTKDDQIAALTAQVETLTASGNASDAAAAGLLQPLIDKLTAEQTPPASDAPAPVPPAPASDPASDPAPTDTPAVPTADPAGQGAGPSTGPPSGP